MSDRIVRLPLLVLVVAFSSAPVLPGTIDSLPLEPVDATLAAAGALVQGGTFVADSTNFAEVTIAVWADDGAVGRAVVLATESGVPVGSPLWLGPDIQWPLDRPARSDGLFDLTFRPDVPLVPGRTYFVGMDFGLYGAGADLILFVGAVGGNAVPRGQAWGYLDGSGWNTLGGSDTDLGARIVMTREPGQSGTDVIYSNLGAGGAFDAYPYHGWTINGFLGVGTGQQAISQQFTPVAGTSFGGADLALTLFAGPGSIDVFLQEDSSGLPGPVLEQLALRGLSGIRVPAIHTVTSSLHPRLEEGVPYWLTVVAGEDGVVAGWNWTSIGETSTRSNLATTQGGSPTGPWHHGFVGQARCAFQIVGGPATPREEVGLLMDNVEALLGMDALTRAQADGLTDKLYAALASLDRDNAKSASNQLRAFINHVNALVRSGALTPEQGQVLIDAAEAIREQIG